MKELVEASKMSRLYFVLPSGKVCDEFKIQNFVKGKKKVESSELEDSLKQYVLELPLVTHSSTPTTSSSVPQVVTKAAPNPTPKATTKAVPKATPKASGKRATGASNDSDDDEDDNQPPKKKQRKDEGPPYTCPYCDKVYEKRYGDYDSQVTNRLCKKS